MSAIDIFVFAIAVLIAYLIVLKILVYFLFALTILFFDCIKIRRYKKSNGEAEINEKLTVENCSSKIKKLIMRYYNGVYKFMVKKVAHIPSHSIRKFLYRHLFRVKIGKRVTIYHGLEIRCGFKISIGEGTIIDDNCILDGRGGLEFGKNINLSSDVCIWTMQHSINDEDFCGSGGKVIVKDRAWISSNTTVLPNVCVGEGAVLASGAVATKNLEDYKVYGGIPAKEIGVRNSNLSYEFDGKPCWYL